MNKIKTILFISIFLSFIGCAHEEQKLSENPNENNDAVREFIPVGTSSEDGIKKMESTGFTCSIKRKHKARLHKGTIEIGEIGPIDLILCDKQKQEGILRKWQVILILDQDDRIKDYGITTAEKTR